MKSSMKSTACFVKARFANVSDPLDDVMIAEIGLMSVFGDVIITCN